MKTSDWLGIIIANTLPLETTLADRIGTDLVEDQTDILTSTSGNLRICANRVGRVWLRRAKAGQEMQELVGVGMNNN